MKGGCVSALEKVQTKTVRITWGQANHDHQGRPAELGLFNLQKRQQKANLVTAVEMSVAASLGMVQGGFILQGLVH